MSSEPDVHFLIDGERVAALVLDSVQDTFPDYQGTLIEGPSFPRWRDFIAKYHAADVELDYCPHHPDEGPYEESDLAAYVPARS